jgi:hypothetical protein
LSPTGVWLPATFSDAHARVVFKYLDEGRRSLSFAEWTLVFESFGLLDEAIADTPDGLRRFRSLYESQVENSFADRYIADLLETVNVTAEWMSLWARYARAIVALWRGAGWPERLGPESRLLLSYWLFWWEMFAEGYAFEVQVFRDLKRSDVDFVPHDIHTRQGRRSPYDLDVLGLHGDVKTSVYFLQMGRVPGMRYDFYISRFRYQGRQRWMVVLMQLAAWRKIDGDTEATTWDRAQLALPSVASVMHEGRQIILVEYEMWKTRVRQRQSEGE